MDRLTNIDQASVDYWRQWNLDASVTEDEHLPPADRRTRAVVAQIRMPTGEYVDTVLKPNDDVIFYGSDTNPGIPCRVIGAGAGREWVCVYNEELFGDTGTVRFESMYITDRAPADPEEVPMPIWYPPEPPAEPPPDGTVKITTTFASHDHSATVTTTIDDGGIHTNVGEEGGE